MAHNDTKSGGDFSDTPSDDVIKPTVIMQSGGHATHMYPFPSQVQPSSFAKRRQVRNACTNCQKSCKKCDDARPCLRCVKYGVPEQCVDSQRKERKKGVKRGPYKKRNPKDCINGSASPTASSQHVPGSNDGPPASASPPLVGQFVPGFFGQYLPPHVMPPVDGSHWYPQFLPVPQPIVEGAHGGGHNGYPPPPHYYPTIVPFRPPPVYPYMVPQHDGLPMYLKVGGAGDDQGRQEGGGGGGGEE